MNSFTHKLNAMIENSEIKALFHLIDDPDEEVFNSVSNRLVSFGKGIIPNLENLWENTFDDALQKRIEMVIHRLHFRDLKEDLERWKNDSGELLEGALMVTKYMYPDLSTVPTLQEIEKIRRNIWLELNSYLTPLEQIGVISGILFSYYKFRGNEINYETPEDFLFSRLLENKRGNAISNGILYLIICKMLDVPVTAVNIPRQFILAYFSTEYDYEKPLKQMTEKLSFFIDPLNGQVYSQKDVENYFKRISVPPVESYFKQLSNQRVIQYLLEELSKCYNTANNDYKKKDLLELAKIFDE